MQKLAEDWTEGQLWVTEAVVQWVVSDALYVS